MRERNFEFILGYQNECHYRPLFPWPREGRWRCLPNKTLTVGYQVATVEEVRIFNDWMRRKWAADVKTMRERPQCYDAEFLASLGDDIHPDRLAIHTIDA